MKPCSPKQQTMYTHPQQPYANQFGANQFNQCYPPPVNPCPALPGQSRSNPPTASGYAQGVTLPTMCHHAQSLPVPLAPRGGSVQHPSAIHAMNTMNAGPSGNFVMPNMPAIQSMNAMNTLRSMNNVLNAMNPTNTTNAMNVMNAMNSMNSVHSMNTMNSNSVNAVAPNVGVGVYAAGMDRQLFAQYNALNQAANPSLQSMPQWLQKEYVRRAMRQYEELHVVEDPKILHCSRICPRDGDHIATSSPLSAIKLKALDDSKEDEPANDENVPSTNTAHHHSTQSTSSCIGIISESSSEHTDSLIVSPVSENIDIPSPSAYSPVHFAEHTTSPHYVPAERPKLEPRATNLSAVSSAYFKSPSFMVTSPDSMHEAIPPQPQPRCMLTCLDILSNTPPEMLSPRADTAPAVHGNVEQKEEVEPPREEQSEEKEEDIVDCAGGSGSGCSGTAGMSSSKTSSPSPKSALSPHPLAADQQDASAVSAVSAVTAVSGDNVEDGTLCAQNKAADEGPSDDQEDAADRVHDASCSNGNGNGNSNIGGCEMGDDVGSASPTTATAFKFPAPSGHASNAVNVFGSAPQSHGIGTTPNGHLYPQQPQQPQHLQQQHQQQAQSGYVYEPSSLHSRSVLKEAQEAYQRRLAEQQQRQRRQQQQQQQQQWQYQQQMMFRQQQLMQEQAARTQRMMRGHPQYQQPMQQMEAQYRFNGRSRVHGNAQNGSHPQLVQHQQIQHAQHSQALRHGPFNGYHPHSNARRGPRFCA